MFRFQDTMLQCEEEELASWQWLTKSNGWQDYEDVIRRILEQAFQSWCGGGSVECTISTFAGSYQVNFERMVQRSVSDSKRERQIKRVDSVPPPPTPPSSWSNPSMSNQCVSFLRPCRYGAQCREIDDAFHCERFSHPGQDCNESFFSEEGDQHIGTKYPRVRCKNHPGCARRKTCFYSHGLVHSIASCAADGSTVKATCFLGQPPHNQACNKPTPSGEPLDFCSQECKAKARLTPKGKLGCRREGCPCPCTVNGVEGQFCCDACKHGIPCKEPTHTCPTAHLVAVAQPAKGKYAPCKRSGCKCSGADGSSWNGKPGGYCCRACRNGTPCTKLWHTVPESVAQASAEKAYRGHECQLNGCTNPTWNGKAGEYCCVEHRRTDRKRKSEEPQSAAASDSSLPVAISDVAVRLLIPAKFPDYATLYRSAESWAKSNGAGGAKGAVVAVWQNTSLLSPSSPARMTFECAVKKVNLNSWDQGEFGWHGTKSMAAIEGISWGNWNTQCRSGQANGPGEYFSRGTTAGLQYSLGYAGGDAGHLLIVAWIISCKLGGAPNSPASNGAGNSSGGHIVCNNPVTSGNVSTGEMYCIPIAVVAFGSASPKPNFKTQ